MEPVTLEQLAYEVSLMRTAQKEYFKYRNPTALKKSISHEQRVDAMLTQIAFPKTQTSKQGNLL